MTRKLDFTLLCIFLALFTQLVSADNANRTASPEEQLLKAITHGDLAEVKKVAATIDLGQVVNLPYHALGSPNADVVEFLRAKCDLRISDLQMAAIRDDVMTIRHLLATLDKRSKTKALADWYEPSLFSYSPLSLAVRHGHTNTVRELIASDANINEATRYTLTPLANAAELGHVDIVNLLLEAGAQVNSAPDGYTALMRACCGGQPKTAWLLLEAGADPNQKRHNGQRALHFAAKRGNAECVKLLVKHGADINAVAYGKNTALTYAQLYKFEDVIKLVTPPEEEGGK